MALRSLCAASSRVRGWVRRKVNLGGRGEIVIVVENSRITTTATVGVKEVAVRVAATAAVVKAVVVKACSMCMCM